MKLYFKTREVWDAMYQDCLDAKSAIEFEQYIAHDDEVGNRFLRLFADKAKQGINVRLLFDRVGARRVYNSKLLDEIRACGEAAELIRRQLSSKKDWFSCYSPF